eukprot:TRINITY_DN1601_c0_g1_i2.p1 TRINITY_DN1601_c0_g1~~TRINITY_DN1601_c0_g1_i2.p1  ORF type:complete len:221 (-),score=45.12 TRINITY_DN1601_c0_g1_i2:27-689(-)
MESKVSGDGGDSGLWHAQVGDRTTSEEVVYNGKFLKAKTIHYTRGTLHKLWEGCDRTTRGSGGIDAVAIFTIIKSKKEGWAKTVLVKQYRPPIKNVSVEFPAGLIDEGETPDITAIRELKEETGYTGTVVSVSPVCVADPGLSSANMAVVTVHVDADAKENLKPVQMQDDSTFIEVALVDMAEFFNTLQAWAKEGFLIDANVWCLAYGLHMATNEVKKSM